MYVCTCERRRGRGHDPVLGLIKMENCDRMSDPGSAPGMRVTRAQIGSSEPITSRSATLGDGRQVSETFGIIRRCSARSSSDAFRV